MVKKYSLYKTLKKKLIRPSQKINKKTKEKIRRKKIKVDHQINSLYILDHYDRDISFKVLYFNKVVYIYNTLNHYDIQ